MTIYRWAKSCCQYFEESRQKKKEGMRNCSAGRLEVCKRERKGGRKKESENGSESGGRGKEQRGKKRS